MGDGGSRRCSTVVTGEHVLANVVIHGRNLNKTGFR